MSCTVTMRSVVIPGHTHTCSGEHSSVDHKCKDRDCRRWFYPREV